MLAEYVLSPSEREAQGREKVGVAVRSGHLLATAFHPELTSDTRWHELFVNMVREHERKAGDKAGPSGTEATNGVEQASGVDHGSSYAQKSANGVRSVEDQSQGRPMTYPGDLPVY